MATKKIFTKVKIKALPAAELKEKLKFHATKILSKEMKIIKNLLTRKLIRKLQERESNSDDSSEKLLLSLKKVDHTVIGKAIAGSMSIFSANIEHETAAHVEAHIFDYFKNHRRTKEIIEALEKKFNSSIQKNNNLRSKEQKALAKKQNLSNMIMKRRLDAKERTTAVFLDSLEDGGKADEERIEKQKEMDKQRKLLAKKNKKLKILGKRKSDSIANDSSRSYYTGDHTQSSAPPLGPSHTSNNNSSSRISSSNGGGGGGNNMGPPSKRINSDSRIANHRSSTLTNHPPHRASSASAGGSSGKRATQEAPLSSELVAHGGKDWKTSGIHPSWAAKQLAKKSAVVISVTTTPAAGKKITFDDD